MRLIALNLNGRSIDKSTVRKGSVVVEESDVDDDVLSYEEHVAKNEKRFKESFKDMNVLHDDKIVTLKRNQLHASNLRYTHMNPGWYRSDGYLFPGDLDGLICRFESDRGESLADNETKWKKVGDNKRVLAHLSRFISPKGNECAVRDWLNALALLICVALSEDGYCERLSEQLVGLGGALAFEGETEAAYVSKVNHYFLRANLETPFIGIEYKRLGVYDGKQWYKIDSSLAQTLCALAGNTDCFAGLLLCDMGFTIIWREPARCDEDGVPIDNYFVYPPVEDGKLKYCYSPNSSVQDRGSAGRMELLRVVYEIVRSSMTVKDENEEPSSPQNVKKARIAESPKKSSKHRKTPPGFPRTVVRPKSTPQKIGVVDRSGHTHYMFAYGVLKQEIVYDSQCDSSDENMGNWQPGSDSSCSSSDSEVVIRANEHRE